MRKIIITGNCGKDPETRSMPSGDSFVVFTVAVNAGTKANPKTDWMEVNCKDKLGEIALKYLRKGTKVLVEGYPSVNAYINKENKAVGTLRIHANNFEILSSKNDAEQSNNAEDAETTNKTYGQQSVEIKAGLVSDEVPF